MDAPRTLLFDTASLYFRAFFGLPDSLRAKSGDPVNAVRGLLDFLARFITDCSPTHVACCWDDAWRPAWRVDLVPSYKAHRVAYGDVEEVPAALTAQVPWIRATLDALGLPIVGAADHEADDVIATLATRSTWPVDVVTGDRDLFQLVDDDRAVRVLYVGRGVAKHEQITDAWLQAKYTITGAGYVDFAVMRGDPSDGLPGVKGIGEKSAAGLVAAYPTLEAIVEAATDSASGMSPAMRAKLTADVGYLARAREVVTAVDTLALPDLTRRPVNHDKVEELTERYALGGALTRLAATAR